MFCGDLKGLCCLCFVGYRCAEEWSLCFSPGEDQETLMLCCMLLYLKAVTVIFTLAQACVLLLTNG